MAISTLNVAGTIQLLDGGNVVMEFIDAEMPTAVRYVPGHNTIVHKFIGGARHFDQMGADYDVIKWEGTFLTTDSIAKIILLEELVVAGDPLTLHFNYNNYTVTIKNVTFDHRGTAICDYSIELYVLQNADEVPNANDVNPQNLLNGAGGAINNG